MGEKPEDLRARGAGDVIRDAAPLEGEDPVSPGEPGQATTVKGSKSNSSERTGGPVDPGPGGPVEATNLNSSRSNVYRSGGPGDPGPGEPTEAVNLNSSKSNVYRTGVPDEDEPAAGTDVPGPERAP